MLTGWLGCGLSSGAPGCGPSARAPGATASASSTAAASASAPPAPPSPVSAAPLPDPPWPAPPRRDDLRPVGEARVVRGHAGGRYRVQTWTSDPAAYAASGPAPVGLVVCAEQREASGGGKAAGPNGAPGLTGASRPAGASRAAGAAGGAAGASGSPADEGPWLCLRRGASGWGHGVQLPGQAGWARQGVLGDCAGCHDGFAR